MRTSLAEGRDRAKRTLSLQSELQTQQHWTETLSSNLADLNHELASIPEADQVLMEELAAVETAIRQAENVLSQYNESQIIATQQANLKHDVESLSAAVTDQEIFVKALGPDGLRKELLGGILQGFVSQVNNRLGRLTESTYHINLAPDMTVLCCANGGPFLPLKLLSKSEQLRVGIAVSAALSSAVGLRFLAIDEADMLDQENRDLLAGMLLDTAEEFDQIFVFTLKR